MRRVFIAIFVLSILSMTPIQFSHAEQSSPSQLILAPETQVLQRVYGTNLASEIYYACETETFRSYVQEISAIGPDWVMEKLDEVSNGRVEVSLIGSHDNVVGKLPGYLPGDNPVFVISAHYDTAENSPGANDDGSGIALVLELARVMSQYEWPLDIYFCAFNNAVPAAFGQPFQGSAQVASSWSSSGLDILALYNIDSILISNRYADADERILLGYSEASAYRIGEYWADLAEMVGNLNGFDIIRPMSSDSFPLWTQSDHIKFYQQGYQQVLCAYESGYFFDSTTGGPDDLYENSNHEYHLGRMTAGVLGASMAFSMSRSFGEPIKLDIDGIIFAGSTRTFKLAITAPTTIDLTVRWWGGGAEFSIYDPNSNLLDQVLFPDASAWEANHVLSVPVTTPGMYRVVIFNQADVGLGYETTLVYDSDVNGNGIADRNDYWINSTLFQTDEDHDTLSDAMEMIIGTDLDSFDTDLDLMSDGWEYEYGFNPRNATDAQDDDDQDGVLNVDEFLNSLNPLSADTDMDLIPDLFELEHGLDPLVNDADLDLDDDGLSNIEEYLLGSDPQAVEQEPLDMISVIVPSSAVLLIGAALYFNRKYSNLMGR
ncbi:MAG: M28 family metallopeptidase [Candidatus Thorarchaeota archaeon]|jgi:hypothetical protein